VFNTETEKSKHFVDRERFYRAVGTKMRAVRDKMGIKQEAIAASVGLSRTSITNIERGRQNLSLFTFIEIASVLKSTVADLLPDRTNIFNEIHDQLPATLTHEQKDFIARAITPSALHEPTKTRENTPQSPPTNSRKQTQRSPGRR
jgi:DNA-binding XRE family transcriptional regulator